MYSDKMKRLIVIEELASRIDIAIRKGNPSALKNCRTYHATMTRQMTPEDIYLLLRTQDVKCPLCGLSFENVRWDIEHDPQIERTYKVRLVRGLMCHRCNVWLRDWEGAVRRAVQYLDGSVRSVLK
jgi:recombination endonuclease VII